MRPDYADNGLPMFGSTFFSLHPLRRQYWRKMKHFGHTNTTELRESSVGWSFGRSLGNRVRCFTSVINSLLRKLVVLFHFLSFRDYLWSLLIISFCFFFAFVNLFLLPLYFCAFARWGKKVRIHLWLILFANREPFRMCHFNVFPFSYGDFFVFRFSVLPFHFGHIFPFASLKRFDVFQS